MGEQAERNIGFGRQIEITFYNGICAFHFESVLQTWQVLHFLILLPLCFALALTISLFFTVTLVIRASEWLGRKKENKSDS